MRVVAANKALFGRFWSDASGSVTAFTTVMFLMMVVGAGMAVDFMRHEAHRVELQDALDRGVLAAAALDQVRPAEDTIRGFLRTTSFVADGYTLNVKESNDDYTRQITASVELDLRTYFLKIVGRPSLKVAAHGSAYESKQDIEISLVLDVSTSMSGCKLGELPCTIDDMDFTGFPERSRLDQMKTDAQEFVDLMVNGRTRDLLTMSIVPFAGQVNPGPVAFGYLAQRQVHPYSYCMEFSAQDFLRVAAPGSGSRAQSQYFSYSSYYTNPHLDSSIEYGWCPGGNSEQIIYHSDDADRLKAHIAGLKTHEGTGSQYGMKWGAMLLDPSSNALTQRLHTAGEVKTAFSDRPGAYEPSERMKFLIFMSDGNTTRQVRVRANRYDSSTERDWWATNVPTSRSRPHNYGDIDRNYVSSRTARRDFLSLCNDARTQGITVFTIGFDITDGSTAQTDLRACASTPSHFHDVDGMELSSAFSAIAATIQKLKLVN